MDDDTLSEYDQWLWTSRFGDYDDEMLQDWCDRIARGASPPGAVDRIALAELERRRAAASEKGPT